MNRKVFIKTTGRIIILGGLAVAAGYLVATQKVKAACSVSQACQKCSQIDGCKLPQAIRAKRGEQPQEKAAVGHSGDLTRGTNNGS